MYPSSTFNRIFRPSLTLKISHGLDIFLMQSVANRVVGEHDFRHCLWQTQENNFHRCVMHAQINSISLQNPMATHEYSCRILAGLNVLVQILCHPQCLQYNSVYIVYDAPISSETRLHSPFNARAERTDKIL